MASAEFYEMTMQVHRVTSQCGFRTYHLPFWVCQRARELLSQHSEEQAVDLLREELAQRR